MGNSLLENRREYISVDIETTGLDPQKNRIIELAAIRIKDGEATEKFSELIDPEEKVSGFITELTGITNDMLAGARKIEEVLPEFLEFIGDSVILGQNVRFDIGFIDENSRKLLGRAFENDYIDTLRISRMLFKEYRHHRLCDQIERFGIGESVEHRALADAEQTYRCYEYMMRYMQENGIGFEQKKETKRFIRAKDILPQKEIDGNSAFFGKGFVFTGTLSRFSRELAMQMVVDGGGWVSDSVSKKTDYLVLGKNASRTVSTKQKRAEALGCIEIISEEVFISRFIGER
ncbi:MAG: 3'-5' exoribonuclease [Christensenellaceae bacterium]|nr:3'-5' exoribonuclease [Christensenellaceae bacterium]